MSETGPTQWTTEIESLYRSEARRLWALFYAQCTDAERSFDALQEAFVRLHKHLESDGEPIRDLRAWLVHVGRNYLRDTARRKANAVRLGEALDQRVGAGPEPASVLADQEIQGKIREILGQLREDDRAVLILRYGLGWSSSRMGDVLGISAAAVDMRLSRARKRMAELLESAGVDHDTL